MPARSDDLSVEVARLAEVAALNASSAMTERCPELRNKRSETIVLDEQHTLTYYINDFGHSVARLVAERYGEHDAGCPAIADDESDVVLYDYLECACGLQALRRAQP